MRDLIFIGDAHLDREDGHMDPFLAFVITSYSIHYTKLYDDAEVTLADCRERGIPTV